MKTRYLLLLAALWLVFSGSGSTSASPVTNAGPRSVTYPMSEQVSAVPLATLEAASTNGPGGMLRSEAVGVLAPAETGGAMLLQSLLGGGAPQFIPSSTRLLNVDLAADPSYKIGPAAVGYDTNDFWNCYWNPGVTDPTTIPNLLWSDQQTSGIDMTVVNAPGGWGNGVADPMFSGYLYQWDGQELEVYFSNIPPGSYDLLLYGHGPRDIDNSVFQAATGTSFAGRRGTSIWSPLWNSAEWEEGIQYVRYRQITIESGDTLAIIVEPDVNGYALFNGLQLVQSSALSEPPVALRQLLNVDFAGSTLKTGPAAFGQGPADLWNWYLQCGQANGALTNLAWADSTPSGVGLTVQNASGCGVFTSSDPMYSGFVYPGSSGAITLTLTNLPPEIYDFCFYAHTATEDDNSVIELWNGSTLLDTRGTSLWGDHTATTNWQEGQQFVIFRNVPVAAGEVITAVVQPGGQGYAVLNGMQVVARLDRDADGLPDWWEFQYFGDLSQGPGDDPDSDNYSNLLEYQLGRNPMLAATAPDSLHTVGLSVFTPLHH